MLLAFDAIHDIEGKENKNITTFYTPSHQFFIIYIFIFIILKHLDEVIWKIV